MSLWQARDLPVGFSSHSHRRVGSTGRFSISRLPAVKDQTGSLLCLSCLCSHGSPLIYFLAIPLQPAPRIFLPHALSALLSLFVALHFSLVAGRNLLFVVSALTADEAERRVSIGALCCIYRHADACIHCLSPLFFLLRKSLTCKECTPWQTLSVDFVSFVRTHGITTTETVLRQSMLPARVYTFISFACMRLAALT